MRVKILYRFYPGSGIQVGLGAFRDDPVEMLHYESFQTADEKIEATKLIFGTIPGVEFKVDTFEIQ